MPDKKNKVDQKVVKQLEHDLKAEEKEVELDVAYRAATGDARPVTQERFNRSERIWSNSRKLYPGENQQ